MVRCDPGGIYQNIEEGRFPVGEGVTHGGEVWLLEKTCGFWRRQCDFKT
jgi:hypothetical protein